MRSRLLRSATTAAACLVVLPLAASSCGGADDVVGADGLNNADVTAMVAALNELGAFSFDLALVSQPVTPGLAAQMRTSQINRDVSCAGGGVVHFTGTWDTYYSGVQAAYSIQMFEAHEACQTPEVGGRQWTFDGNPNVTVQIDYISNSNAHTIKMVGSSHGSFTWKSSTGATGTCDEDVKLSANGAPGSRDNPGLGVVTGQITGHVCGRYVDVHY